MSQLAQNFVDLQSQLAAAVGRVTIHVPAALSALAGSNTANIANLPADLFWVESSKFKIAEDVFMMFLHVSFVVICMTGRVHVV
jgi:phosphate starvation-inducible membrane PsiE